MSAETSEPNIRVLGSTVIHRYVADFPLACAQKLTPRARTIRTTRAVTCKTCLRTGVR